MNAQQFAINHSCDADWVVAMGDRNVIALKAGQRGTYSGYEATVLKHYANGMYVIKTSGGSCCINGADFIPDNQS